ncbi:hypothetical protein PLUTE_a4985 [Pseudoalteromonas luteoviolacea DSM 6061]|nr:hypothetical protein [Pseudoalteromonas luteoviolacea DSM 6061]MBE0388681.1 hypothetical protein [Pseudoalteromonas luteoviolacea DSM 6061]
MKGADKRFLFLGRSQPLAPCANLNITFNQLFRFIFPPFQFNVCVMRFTLADLT